MAFRDPKKNVNHNKDPHDYRNIKKIYNREKRAQNYFDGVSNRSQSGPAAFIHPADHVPWSKKKGNIPINNTTSKKIHNKKTDSQTGFIIGSILIIIVLVIILLAILLR
jgi:hypothetical protein